MVGLPMLRPSLLAIIGCVGGGGSVKYVLREGLRNNG